MKKNGLINRVCSLRTLTGPTWLGELSSHIGICRPVDKEQWKKYIFNNIYTKHTQKRGCKKITTDYIKSHAKYVHACIKEYGEEVKILSENITQEDVFKFIIDLMCDKTYDGFCKGQEHVMFVLRQKFPDIKIIQAPQEWDSKGVDLICILSNEKRFGIQVKPESYEKIVLQQVNKLKNGFEKFKTEYGGNVFIVYYEAKKDKSIKNKTQILIDIELEIKRLQNETS